METINPFHFGSSQRDSSSMTESKRRGRPPATADRQVFEKLLNAAEQCLETKTIDEITVREIARNADVNPAMISYYFENKEGLFVALVEFLFSEWVRLLRELEETFDELTVSPTQRFVEIAHDCFYRHHATLWLLNRALNAPDSAIYDVYRSKLASRTSVATRRFIQAMGEKGIYRTDIDLDYLTFAVSCLTTHPVSIAPRMAQAYGFGMEELLSAEWRLFLESSLDRLLRP